ncbi:T9SS type A sorting domain-containing protein [Aquimarina aggregata]|uniref:T9SS type A sorting domain-containing protein n=1 Tax=Aquimarina aggregata TaxID=1642818 RepID=UPI00248FBDA6|nr:T9SS type A sorting domain-containing protein [Aquimarina aggregata]
MLDLDYKPDIANYGLGYIEMKGLTHRNRIGQYYVARRLFNASNLPMAKHWLAVMDYNGYGIINNVPNKAKALQNLQDNNILNSKILRASLIAQENNWIPISQEEDKLLREGPGFTPLDKNKLNKTFDGKLIEYDWGWRKKEVRRYQSFTIKFTPNSSTTIPYELKINGQTYTGTGRIAGNIIRLSLVIPLKVIYPDHPEISEVKYIFKRLAFRETTLGGDQVWIIKPERGFTFASQENWRERIHNVRFILKDQNTTASTTRLSATITDTADFAVISPNPISDQFTITYNFNKSTDIKVAIYDLYGNKKIDLPAQRTNGIGHKTLPIDSSNLTKGIYLVQMTVNGATYTKTISKN